MKTTIQNSDAKTASIASKDIFSFNEACVFLDVSASWLYKLTYSNTIPYYKPNGKKIYFKKKDLEDWILGAKIKSNKEIENIAVNHQKPKY